MNYAQRNDRHICYEQSQKGGFLARIVRRLTRWAWRQQVYHVVDRLHERGLIDTNALHEGRYYAQRLIDCEEPRCLPVFKLNVKMPERKGVISPPKYKIINSIQINEYEPFELHGKLFEYEVRWGETKDDTYWLNELELIYYNTENK